MASIGYFTKKGKREKATVYLRVRNNGAEFNISSGLNVFVEDLSKGNTFLKKNVSNATTKQLKTTLYNLKKVLIGDIDSLL